MSYLYTARGPILSDFHKEPITQFFDKWFNPFIHHFTINVKILNIYKSKPVF